MSIKYKKNTGILWFLIFFLITSCSTGKYVTTEKKYHKKAKVFAKTYSETPSKQLEKVIVGEKQWIASPNFGVRKPNYVMIHHTAQNSLDQTIKTFHNEQAEVSSHYVISRDGEVVQMVNDYFRAHHAGAGKWGNDTDLNSSSIGIELDNNGTTDPWPQEQINALLALLDYLKTTYNIPQKNFIGHMDYAPKRKIDPSRFPWKTLADKGFGYWHDDNLPPAPKDFDPKIALRVIGYDVSDLNAAIRAFKTHYIQEDDSPALSADQLAILYNIMQKYF